MPARPPPSIVMLQIVIRPGIESASIAGPANSTAKPVMPPVPSLPIVARIRSFGVTPVLELAGVVDPHRARLFLHHALGREDVLDLGGADAEGQRAEGAVGGGVAVAADDRHAGLGDAQLRADHVDDPLAVGAEAVELDPELLAVAFQGFDLDAGELVGDQAGGHRAVGRRVVVGRRQRLVDAADRAAGQAEAVEGLRRGDLVDQVQVDVDQPLADLMLLPDLFEHVLGHC